MHMRNGSFAPRPDRLRSDEAHHSTNPETPVIAERRGAAAESITPAPISTADTRFAFMVGNSPVMRTVFELIRRFARTQAPVLITGESGTGKELAARAIHEYSARARGPFVPVNCASLPSELIASELFGYEKGAFTGASARHRGLVEAADGGTLFLDEIGDLGVGLQGHLLRFLQEGRIVRLGGHVPITVDVRIVSATNIAITKAVAEKRFREDLFYRLNGLDLHMPPLRERGDDISILAMYFLRRLAPELGRDVKGFDAAARVAMRHHPWPGNVREMIAAIRRAIVVGNDPLIGRDDLALVSPDEGTRSLARPRPGSDEEREILLAALARHHNVLSRVAVDLHVSRVTVYRMLERHGLARTPKSSTSETPTARRDPAPPADARVS